METNKKDTREAGSTGNMPAGPVIGLAWENLRPTVGLGAGMKASRHDKASFPAMVPGQARVNPEGPPAVRHPGEGGHEVETSQAGTCSTAPESRSQVGTSKPGRDRR